jgi:hypothetical protein
VKYHPNLRFDLLNRGQGKIVSLTGAVAFEKVTKVCIRQVDLDMDPNGSIRTNTCQTARMTIQAGMISRRDEGKTENLLERVGPSDLVIPSGRVITYRTKGTLGITG